MISNGNGQPSDGGACSLISIAVVLMFVGMSVPTAVAAEETIREQNREYLLSQFGEDWDPAATAELRVNGQPQEMSSAEALDHLLDATERVNLREAAQRAHHPNSPVAGDVVFWTWGQCIEPPHTDTPTRYSPLDNQFWLHEGGLMNGTAPEDSMYSAPTTKSYGYFDNATYRGNGNTVCFLTPGLRTFSSAALNGVAI